jgi:hypothetical protein
MGADDERTRPVAVFNRVAQTQAARTLREGGAVLKRPYCDEGSEHGNRIPSFSNGIKKISFGVVERNEDARRASVRVDALRVVEPTRRRQGQNAFESGVAADLFIEFLRGGESAIRVANDGDTAEQSGAKACRRSAAATGAEWFEEKGVITGNIVSLLDACKRQYVIFVDRGRQPMSCKEGQRGVNAFKVCPDRPENAVCVNPQEAANVSMRMVEDNGIPGST